MSSGSSSSDSAVGIVKIVGGVAGGFLLLTVVITASKKKRNKERTGDNNSSTPVPMRTRNIASNNQRGTVDTLPSYNLSQHDPHPPITDTDVQYDVPAAFDLATAIVLSESQASPPRRVDEEEGKEEGLRLTTFERMRHVQCKLNQLKQLTFSARPEGYRVGSEEYGKAVRLRREIAGLMEEPQASPRVGTHVLTSIEVLGSGSSSEGPQVVGPVGIEGSNNFSQGGSLYERMLEIQRLLSRIDAITSTSPSSGSTSIPSTSSSTRMQDRIVTEEAQVMTPEQVSATVRDLSRRVAELMDLPDLSPALSPVSHTGGSHPHFAANQASDIRGSGERRGGEETNGNDNNTADRNNGHYTTGLPPPYEVAVSNPSDGRDLNGTDAVT